ncbi:hypothetical protein GCM10009864_50820 [Streptomyces lunalinharesii]|uniref:Uncharacterized protein n=1 Tax=Streptomyces lunalinharesii TaxID=333384 RepID=A0ABN3SDY1_9ACTN
MYGKQRSGEPVPPDRCGASSSGSLFAWVCLYVSHGGRSRNREAVGAAGVARVTDRLNGAACAVVCRPQGSHLVPAAEGAGSPAPS